MASFVLQEGQTMDFREPNPFAGDEAGQVASVAYRCAGEPL